jgi:hypothetical protein
MRTTSQNPEPLPAFSSLCELLELRLRQFAIGNDGRQMIAHLADDVDGEKQLLAPRHIIDHGTAPGGNIVRLELVERFWQQLVVQCPLTVLQLAPAAPTAAFTAPSRAWPACAAASVERKPQYRAGRLMSRLTGTNSSDGPSTGSGEYSLATIASRPGDPPDASGADQTAGACEAGHSFSSP